MLLLLANKWNLELRKHDLSFPESRMVQVYYIFVQLVLIAKAELPVVVRGYYSAL